MTLTEKEVWTDTTSRLLAENKIVQAPLPMLLIPLARYPLQTKKHSGCKKHRPEKEACSAMMIIHIALIAITTCTTLNTVIALSILLRLLRLQPKP